MTRHRERREGSGLREAPAVILTFIALLALFAAQVFATYHLYTAGYAGAVDFFARWEPARLLFTEGLNPYSNEAAMRTQIGLQGRLSGPGEDSWSFAYPLFVVFLIAPLTGFPYSWAQAIWQVSLLWSTIAATLLLLRARGLELSFGRLLLIVGAVVLFYPLGRAIANGQISVVTATALTLALVASYRNRRSLTGISLAISLVKPQMSAIIVGLWLVRSVVHRDWTTLRAFLVTIGLLVLAGLALVPNWPIDFLHGLFDFRDTARTIYEIRPLGWIALTGWLGPWTGVAFAISGLLAFVGVISVWQRRSSDVLLPYVLTVLWSLVFLLYQPSTNYVSLLPLFAVWLVRAPWSLALGTVAIIGPLAWMYYLHTQVASSETIWQPAFVIIPAVLLVSSTLVRDPPKHIQILSRRPA